MNQVSPPAFTIAPPVDFASIYVSNTQWIVLGEHALPVRSEVAVLVGMQILFFSRHSDASASAAEDAAQSMMRSTPSASIHCLPIATATSGLFWLSADKTS